MTSDISREPTAVDLVAERWVDTLVELEPTLGTSIGRAEANRRLGDLSPEGVERARAATAAALAELESAVPVDAVDAVTVADLGADLRLSLEAHAAQLPLRDLNVIASPAQELRDVFDLMPTDSDEQWSNIASRLAGVPQAVNGYLACLREGVRRGELPPALQVREGVAQAAELADPGSSFFTTFHRNGTQSQALGADLQKAGLAAAESYGVLAEFLRELEAHAPAADAAAAK